MYMDERLARCRIEVPSGKRYYRYTGVNNQDSPIDAFHPNGDLRLAQQYLSGDEYVFLIRERFVVSSVLLLYPAVFYFVINFI